MILASPPKGWKRPSMPVTVKLAVMLRQNGRCAETGAKLDSNAKGGIHYDHRPGLWERKFDTETNNTIPAANDPEFIDACSVEGHDRRTNGPGGEKRITSAGSDTHRRAKIKRITGPKKAKAKIPQRKNPWPKGRKIGSRPWPAK